MASLSVNKAQKNRDAFVAAVYAHLFDWLVQQINAVGRSGVDNMESFRFIGVLDIFGFEIFQTNSFEQLCINFANERLQRNFTTTTFQQEEGLYEAEGIAFEHIPYVDNQPVLDLIDCAVPSRRGILQLLDEEVRLPNTSDATLLAKMHAQYAAASGSPAYSKDFKRPDVFTVRHYAGDVVYAVDGFLEKAVENVSADLVSALRRSTVPLVALLFHQTSSRQSTAPGDDKKSRKPSVGVKFAKQLTSLIATIEETDAHFIRCIKPNTQRSATAFEPRLTLEQLRYSGVFEAVAIRKCGYPFRLTHVQFANRYRCLLPSAKRQALSFDASRANVELLIQGLGEAGFDMSEVKMGSTRTFYRSPTNRALESARETFLEHILGLLTRACRGAIARGARRQLAAARDGLRAAVSAKQLEALEAAMRVAATPARTFYHGAPLEFTLHVPDLAEITALQADLVEEVRVEASLAEKIGATDLAAVFPSLRAEYGIALELRERLGRPVASLASAECVVGLSEGVAEHDHERLSAAMASAKALGLDSRLSESLAKAREEIERLETGMVYERTLSSELAKGRSKYLGSGKWDHTQIATDALKLAADTADDFGLLSKSGLRLIAHARVALRIRAELVKPDWKGLVAVLDGVAAAGGVEESAEEVGAARSELNDECTQREAALETALGVGRVQRLGEGRWDHGLLQTSHILGAQKLLQSFPFSTDRGEALLARTAFVVELRGTLEGCDWEQAASWAPLATLLEGASPQLREADEVTAAWQEFREVQSSTEAAVRDALDKGRSVRLPTGGWSHEQIALEPLRVALAELEAFPRRSDAGGVLATRAVRTTMLRQALLSSELASAASWVPLAEVLAAGTGATDRSSVSSFEASAGRANDEFVAGREELEDARTQFAERVRAEMGKGRSKQLGVGKWDRTELGASALEDAIEACAEFPHPPTSVNELLEIARVVVKLRLVLAASAWGEPSTWAALADFLDGVDYTASEVDEIKLARLELGECREALEAAMRAALSTGRAVKVAEAWSHEAIETAAVSGAVADLRAFPRLSEAGTQLAAQADVVIGLRKVLLGCDWGAAASWVPLLALLDGLPTGELREADEVRAAWREFADMREATEAAVRAALATGRSERAGGGGASLFSPSSRESRRLSSASAGGRLSISGPAGLPTPPPGTAAVASPAPAGDGGAATPLRSRKSISITSPELRLQPWSHASISSSELNAAAAELAAFPKMSEAGVTLAALAQTVSKLRTLLLAAPWDADLRTSAEACAGWAALAVWLETASKGAHAGEEEVRGAAQELNDKRAAVLRGVKDALAHGRSARVEGGRWSHEGIVTEPLQQASAELGRLVQLLGHLSAPAEQTMLKHAQLTITVRGALLTCDWASGATWAPLATLLEGVAPELNEVDEVTAAWQEFHEVQSSTEAAVRDALDKGRSVRLPTGGWSHEQIALEPLRVALAELEAFPRRSDAGKWLATRAHMALQLRAAQMEATFDSGVCSTSAAQPAA